MPNIDLHVAARAAKSHSGPADAVLPPQNPPMRMRTRTSHPRLGKDGYSTYRRSALNPALLQATDRVDLSLTSVAMFGTGGTSIPQTRALPPPARAASSPTTSPPASRPSLVRSASASASPRRARARRQVSTVVRTWRRYTRCPGASRCFVPPVTGGETLLYDVYTRHADMTSDNPLALQLELGGYLRVRYATFALIA